MSIASFSYTYLPQLCTLVVLVLLAYYQYVTDTNFCRAKLVQYFLDRRSWDSHSRQPSRQPQLQERERRWSGANPNAATTHVIVCKVLDAATSGYCRHSRTKQSKDRHRKQSQCRIWSSGGGGVNISNQQMHSVGARSMFGIPLTLTIDMDWDMSIASYPCTCTYLILLSVMWWYYLLLLLLLLYRA